MSQLRITTHDTATGPVLAVSGELDYTSAPELRALVAGVTLRPGQRLVLDLRGMEFCDSSGITAMIAARGHALDAGADIALAAVPPHTLRVLRLVGLDQVFTVQADAETADHS
ncbi:STAS domain-containing protein [Streptomyces thermolilacinus]|uniref:Anti-sigma factor antagonist n=1 Tax=Streptomyces thermolilacinus SPC6 TaxID=1306406 RepID=A0A1D3DM39_9ACTN|nr:STAS domain-containing protein [Streptomyces thermolilacinus]OEJ93377.1 anti-anti-sigma factor [Streptomyces thermolilacinus SPC6]